MFSFFKEIIHLINFFSIFNNTKKIVFYSEGNNCWIHLKNLLANIEKKTKFPIIYITSDKSDLGLQLKSKRIIKLLITNKSLLNWMISNLDKSIVCMSTPDLNKYGFNKSKKNSKYYYIHHSLCSLHMIYREYAFNAFDVMFCSGGHHLKEIRNIDKFYNLPKKEIVKYGYPRINEIKKNLSIKLKNKFLNNKKTILIAPSWGKTSILNHYNTKLIDLLIEDFNIILRPHPRTIMMDIDLIKKINDKYLNNQNFFYDESPYCEKSFYKSDMLISDWSGIAYEYSLTTNKFVLFIDMPKKINNLNYKKIKIKPFEEVMRNKIGKILKRSNLNRMKEVINRNINKKFDISGYIYNQYQGNNLAIKKIKIDLKKLD